MSSTRKLYRVTASVGIIVIRTDRAFDHAIGAEHSKKRIQRGRPIEMTDSNQDLQPVRIFPCGNGLGLTFRQLFRIFGVTTGDEDRVPEEKAQRIQIMNGMK